MTQIHDSEYHKMKYAKYNDYQKAYALKNNLNKRHCDCCNKDVSYYAYSNHIRTKKHIMNSSAKSEE